MQILFTFINLKIFKITSIKCDFHKFLTKFTTLMSNNQFFALLGRNFFIQLFPLVEAVMLWDLK